MTEAFRRFSRLASDACGTWQAFIINTFAVLIWLGSGPALHWSDAWQLICNTFTTVVTYLLLFLLMNTQSRDTIQLNLKLDTIIAALPRANNAMISLDDLTEDQINSLRHRFDELANREHTRSADPDFLAAMLDTSQSRLVEWP